MKKLTIFYDPNQAVVTESFSPSSRKPKEVMESWLSLEPHLKVSGFDPVTREDFKLVHNAEFVDNIFDLKIDNGFNNRDPNIPPSLCWTAGSMVAAAEEAARTGQWTISPTSGFHHSEYNAAMGFCTFNGLMLAVKKVLDQKLVNNVAVIDLDQHYGNGTESIAAYLNLGLSQFYNYTFGGLGIYVPDHAEPWLSTLPVFVSEICRKYDLIIYQAGADPHVDDPFGGVLTDEQLRRRDDIVFRCAYEQDKPIVWNLAGGYQEPLRKVLDIHDNTLKSCLQYVAL